MTGRLIFVCLLCLYLITGGGKGYSVDGAFGYEMAKTVLLDPESAVLRLGDEVVEAAWVSDPETELRPIDPDFVALWRTFPFARLPRA